MTTADLTRAAQKLRQAQLADMREEEIVAYLRTRGWLVEWPGAVLFARVGGRDQLPAGYPDDDLPFDGSDRRE